MDNSSPTLNPNENITTLAIYSKPIITTVINTILGLPVTEPWLINDAPGFVIEPMPIVEPIVNTVTAELTDLNQNNLKIFCQCYNMMLRMSGMNGLRYST